MTPRPANSVESVARTLYDIAQVFDVPVDTEARLQRALALLCRIVPNDRCALLYVATPAPPRLVVEPDDPQEHAGLGRLLTRFLTILNGEFKAGTDWQLPDLANPALWASPSHLAVPLVALDEVLGVLFVRHRVANSFTNEHLRLLSVVASQIATYLAMCRLRDQQAQIVGEHEAARLEAEASARTRDQFLGTLVHELRGLAARKQVDRMARLLDGVRDALSLVRDKVDLQKAPLVFQDLVASAVASTLNADGAGKHVVSVSLPDEPLVLDADAARLTQIVVNVLDNAARYTPAGGAISVTAYHDDGDVVLSVHDRGIGIAPELLPRIFDLFAQGEQALATAERGLGVGLALARVLVELHGGTIRAHSDGAGRGSEFVVRLPG